MSLLHRKPTAPKPPQLDLIEELRDTSSVLTGWTVRGSGVRDLNEQLRDAAREIERLASQILDEATNATAQQEDEAA